MESDIIVEDFKCSIEMHGLKYTKIVGDGDSSVYKKILETRPHGSACIEKIECRNHLYRNLGTKLREISRRKKSLSTNCCVPISIRKHIMTSTQRLCIAIKKATQYRATETNDLADKIKLLKHDILNCPSHIFGEHKDCVAINYFNCSPKDSEVNYVPEMKACGVYEDILACLHRITYNASSLLHNMNTNDAEHYNAVVCKFIGRKRVNFSLKNSYSIRCKAAALSFNEKSNYYNIIQKALTSKDPRSILKKFIARRHRKNELQRRGQRKFYLKKVFSADHHYGQVQDPIPDFTDDKYKVKEQELLSNMIKSIDERHVIERATVGQSNNPLWFQYRNNRLTASNFGKICKMRLTTSKAKKVEDILYKTFKGNIATNYGKN
ncbi:uncharacterized protein [Onthophagus taurus]|uniref:uncharacterized protein n=1 Tax=Onthophagus taurus TaxID=166361 RepID=UPI0039BE45A4